jgi:hypothetical protein
MQSEPIYSSLAEERYEKQYINYEVHKKKLRLKGAANKQIIDKNIDAKCNVYKKRSEQLRKKYQMPNAMIEKNDINNFDIIQSES